MSDYLFSKALETITGARTLVNRDDIAKATRDQLIRYLESRGFACYDDESTDLLRETAMEDWHNE